jgi:hypothetical protein
MTSFFLSLSGCLDIDVRMSIRLKSLCSICKANGVPTALLLLRGTRTSFTTVSQVSVPSHATTACDVSGEGVQRTN